jgi:hypothetical protein
MKRIEKRTNAVTPRKGRAEVALVDIKKSSREPCEYFDDNCRIGWAHKIDSGPES